MPGARGSASVEPRERSVLVRPLERIGNDGLLFPLMLIEGVGRQEFEWF